MFFWGHIMQQLHSSLVNSPLLSSIFKDCILFFSKCQDKRLLWIEWSRFWTVGEPYFSSVLVFPGNTGPDARRMGPHLRIKDL